MPENITSLEGVQAENAALLDEIADLTKALTGLTCGGSEFFTRKNGRYVADIKACVDWVRRSKEDAHRRTVQAIRRAQAAEDALHASKSESPNV